MAKMIPASFAADTKSGAEKRLFSVLRDGLDDSLTVFHSFDLLVQNKLGKFVDGEIDFLIFSPQARFLTLDVKGGSILCDGEQGAWYRVGMRASGKGYYRFLEFIRSPIRKHHRLLSQIQAGMRIPRAHRQQKSLLELVDEFSIYGTQAPFYGLV